MKHLDEYRDSQRCRQLVRRIRRLATRTWRIMEVCGGQTHGLLRYGIDQALGDAVELLHGPGCPVCVTPKEAIDLAISWSERPDVVLTSFGDMLRVPGSHGSLLRARSRGGDVRVVYSPLDAVELAEKCPEREVVFFAVGFETTAPATALAVQQAAALGLNNFSLLVRHVRVMPAMELLVAEQDAPIDGFLAAGHVCSVEGCASHDDFAARRGRPVVTTGFEPLDLLLGIEACVRLLEEGQCVATNCYPRSVSEQGNVAARQIVADVYEVCDRPWRGIGPVSSGGLRLRSAYARFDADQRFPALDNGVAEPEACRSGEVLAGRIKPPECPSFGRECRPEAPLGAPMVSSEGACAAYYRYVAKEIR